MTVYFIASTLPMISSKSLGGLAFLKTVRRHVFRLPRFREILVKKLLLDAFVYLRGGLMALKTISIHFLELERKDKSRFGLDGNGFLNGLLLNIFLATILISLGTDGWL